MVNTFNKENRDIVEKMNKQMGTEHRSKPYEMNNPADVKQALTIAVSSYRDFEHYERVLDEMMNDFDESLENYDAASWFKLGLADGNPDALAEECVSSLNQATVRFGRITQRAKDNLVMIIKAALSLPTGKQADVLGKSYAIKQEEMDKMIDELLFSFGDVPYNYAIADSFADFLKHIEEEWVDYLI